MILADNGSTDGAPEAAAEKYDDVSPAAHRRQHRLRRRDQPGRRRDRSDVEFVVIANPDVVWGPARSTSCSTRRSAGRAPAALGPLIREPDGTVYPSARARARPACRGAGHALLGTVWKSNPWTAALPAGQRGSLRARGWLAVRLVPAGAPRGVRFDRRFRLALLHVHGGRRFRRPAGQGRMAERLRAVRARSCTRKGHARRPAPGAHAARSPRERVPVPGRPAPALVAGAATAGVAGRSRGRSRIAVRSACEQQGATTRTVRRSRAVK